MKAFNPRPGGVLKFAQHRLQLIGIKPELAVEMTGADVLVGMAFDAWREAKHQANRLPTIRNDGFQTIEVMLVIRHHHHVVAVGQGQLLDRLVVAVEHDPLCGHAAVERRHQLSGRNGIQPKSF